MNKPRLRMIDAFAGIGVASIAADMVWGKGNIEHQFIEINPYSQTILKKHFPNSRIHDDIKTFKPDGTVDIFWGSPPCQAASSAGKRKGTEDKRWLWPDTFRVIREARPKYWILENVRGLLSLEQGVVYHSLLAEMEGLGYEVRGYVVPASAIGALHRRDRVWIVGHSTGDRRTGGGSCAEAQEGLQPRPESAGVVEGGLEGPDSHASDPSSEGIGWKRRIQGFGETEKEAGKGTSATLISDSSIAPHPPCLGLGGCAGEERTDGREGVLQGEQGGCEMGREGEGCCGDVADPDDTRLEGGEKAGNAESGGETAEQRPGINPDCGWLPNGLPDWSADWRKVAAETCARVLPLAHGFGERLSSFTSYFRIIYENLQNKRTPGQTLRALWKIFQSKEIQRTFGRLWEVQDSEILYEILRELSEGPELQMEYGVQGGEKAQKEKLRKLRKKGEALLPPQRWEPSEQLRKQHNDSLPMVSFELAWAVAAAWDCVRLLPKEGKTYKLADGSTISETRNRVEALKACGNSLVLPLVVEIFKAIKYADDNSLTPPTSL